MSIELPHVSEELNLIDTTVLLLLRELVLKYVSAEIDTTSTDTTNLDINQARIVKNIYAGKSDESFTKKVKRNSTPEKLSDPAFAQAVEYYGNNVIFKKYHDYLFIIELLELDMLERGSDNAEIVRLYNKFYHWKMERSGKDMPKDIEDLLYTAEERMLTRQNQDFEKIIELIESDKLTEATDD